jgi:hypothetical protein
MNCYADDENVLAGLTSLLKKKDINECYYWFGLCASRLTRADFWQIYYDFYYAVNEKEDGLEPSDDLGWREIITRWFKAPASPLVFLLRQAKPRWPRSVFIKPAKVPSWLQPFAPPFHNLLRAIKTGNYHHISYQVHTIYQRQQGLAVQSMAVQSMAVQSMAVQSMVEQICTYYQVPFIPPLRERTDDLQYVFAVYAKMHLRGSMQESMHPPESMQEPTTPLPAELEGTYDLPLEVGAFHLRRWQSIEPAVVAAADAEEHSLSGTILKLVKKPQLIAMALGLAAHYDIGLSTAIANYIQSHLTPAEMQWYNPSPEEEIQADLGDMNELIQAFTPDELLPQLGGIWLRMVFPQLEAKMFDLIEYKMFEYKMFEYKMFEYIKN